MHDFVNAAITGRAGAIAIADHAEIRENAAIVAVLTDFDANCDRYHSGQQITNVARNTVEGGPPRTCAGSLEGNPPWGPATEQRFPVIDPERGLVFAVALLHYLTAPRPSQMYVSEVFKVVGGRIVSIDNIGVMMKGVNSLGFVH